MFKKKETELTEEQAQKLLLKSLNIEQNSYYEQFHACKKSCIIGLIIGVVIGIVIGILFKKYGIEASLVMGLMFGVSGVISASGIIGAVNTNEFGMAWLIRFTIPLITGVWNIFCAGSIVTIMVAIALYLLLFFVIFIPYFIFALIFPLETIYYTVRYMIEKKRIEKELASQQAGLT